MPGDVNYAGNLYGGKILDWMDENGKPHKIQRKIEDRTE